MSMLRISSALPVVLGVAPMLLVSVVRTTSLPGLASRDGGSDDTGGGEDAKTRDDDDDEIDEKSENNSVVNPLPTDIAADRGPHDGGGGGGGGGDDAVGGNLDVGSKVVDGEDDDLTST